MSEKRTNECQQQCEMDAQGHKHRNGCPSRFINLSHD